jgi:hypothetical protein
MDHHASGASDISLLTPFLIFIILATPVIILLLMRRANRKEQIKAGKTTTSHESTDGGQEEAFRSYRYDLLRVPMLKMVLRHRAFQFALQLPNAVIFMLVIITGIWGTQLGDKNFATVITWLISGGR